MIRILLRGVIAVMLVAAGWSIGRAQTASPDFELVVDAPAGATSVVCKRGCTLAWVERGVPPPQNRKADFEFKCAGPNVERCSSYTVGGWVTP